MREWPVVGSWIPDENGNGYTPRVSGADLQSQVDTQRRQIEGLQRDLNNIRTQRDNLQTEVESLRSFAAEIEQHRRNVELFNDMLVREVGLGDYWLFYQQFHPDQAGELAREAAGEAFVTRAIRDYIETIRQLAPRSAARIIEELMDTHIDVVVPIMQRLDSTERAMIIGAMEVEKSAVLLRLLFPEGM
jgi:flagellar motility protein MotE (MotC chaperone)